MKDTGCPVSPNVYNTPLHFNTKAHTQDTYDGLALGTMPSTAVFRTCAALLC